MDTPTNRTGGEKHYSADMLEMERPAPYVDNGTDSIDTERYYTKEFMDKEWENLWPKLWVVAGRVSDIAEVGDYIKFDLGHESFIIVRTGTNPDDIKTFYNVCIHRGNQLVMEEMGHVSEGFSCAYHGWEFNIDGGLKKITYRERFRDDVVCDLKGLTEVRCDTWGGFVFITMDDDAKPLMEFLSPLAGQLDAYNPENMIIIKDFKTEWPLNWKTGIDNFNESYHVHWVHSQIPVPFDHTHQFGLYDNGHCRTLAEFRNLTDRDEDEITPYMWVLLERHRTGLTPENFKGNFGDARRALLEHNSKRAETVGLDYKKIADGQLYYLLFPNIILSMEIESMFMLQVLPHPTDPEKMYLRVMGLTHPMEDAPYDLTGYIGVPEGTDISGKTRPETEIGENFVDDRLGPVLIQDTGVLPHVQLGMKSKGISGLIYGEMEQRIRHLHTEIDRYIKGEK